MTHIVDDLRRIAGAEAVLTDEDSLIFFSQDVYRAGVKPLAVVRPGTVDTLAQVVRTATAAGVAVFPRGGGISYTDAYNPTRSQSIVLDLRGLNRIVAINPGDMYVTVEAGCTWAALDAALKPHGLRPPFWGPFSGGKATVGGSLSQGTATFGSARVGPSDVAVLGLRAVTADGSIITTGSGAQPHHAPFFRHYGPDLTGLFTSDAGALGIKAEVTLQLERRPAFVQGLSFAFENAAACYTAMAEVARSGLAGEVFAVDAELLRQSAGSADLRRDFATLIQVGRSGNSLGDGLLRMLKLALAGRNFADGIPFTVHVVTEGNDSARLKGNVRELRAMIAPHGVEMANTVPTVVRANPFPPLAVVAPNGRRLLAIHAIVPFSVAAPLHAETEALVATHADALRANHVAVGYSFATVGRTGLLYEPVFYWEDSHSAFHRQETPPEMLATMRSFPDNPQGRAIVQQVRDDMVELMYTHGAVHLQIGKAYPYLRERDKPFMCLLSAIKSQVDPHGLINPGALGLGGQES
jgi:FAD/FMN-containing dehydrogenase